MCKRKALCLAVGAIQSLRFFDIIPCKQSLAELVVSLGSIAVYPHDMLFKPCVLK